MKNTKTHSCSKIRIPMDISKFMKLNTATVYIEILLRVTAVLHCSALNYKGAHGGNKVHGAPALMLGYPFCPLCHISLRALLSLHCGTAFLLLVLLDIFLRVSGACLVRDEVAGKFIPLRSPTQHGNPFQLHRAKDSDTVDMILERNL